MDGGHYLLLFLVFLGLFKDQDKTGNIIGLIVGIYPFTLLSRYNKFPICMEISSSCYLCIK